LTLAPAVAKPGLAGRSKVLKHARETTDPTGKHRPACGERSGRSWADGDPPCLCLWAKR
jgi:hypothetical protein